MLVVIIITKYMIKFIQTLTITVISTLAFGQNLITNPSAELNPTTNGWTQASGSWVSGSEVPAQGGSFHFYAGNGSGSFELFQDVSVAFLSTTIDAGTQNFFFSGYISAFANGNDPGRIIVEYRNISATVLASYDTGEYSTAAWSLFSDTRIAPVGTRTIRIRLISRRVVGTDNDGYMDDLQLVSGSFPLPIELLKFNTIVNNNSKIESNWVTASEINNDYFTLERSIDAVDWEIVKDIDGAGNSSSLLNYNTIDENPFFGISYYRLKQTDFDGEYSYSQIKSVNIEKFANSQIEIYPNPVNNYLTLSGDKTELSDIIIYNLLGQDVTRVTTQISNTGSKLVIDLTELNTGMYFIKTKTNSKKVYKK